MARANMVHLLLVPTVGTTELMDVRKSSKLWTGVSCHHPGAFNLQF
jgi:hypothetical protein